MAQYYDYEGYPVRTRRPMLDVIAYVLLFAIIGVTLYLAYPVLIARIASAPGVTAPSGAVGNQAPPSVRGSYQEPLPAPAAVATPIPGIAQNAATSQAQYDAIVSAPSVATPDLGPLPENSAGQPIIDAQQQQQLNQSLHLAEQEGGQAADQQLAAQRASANTDAQGRAPDVSAADAAAMLHRDPCHVPRANPATCALGLFKPTPVNTP